MLARVLSAAVNGIEAFPVEVEVNCGWGDTVIVIVMAISPMPLLDTNSARAARTNQMRVVLQRSNNG
jgi:hypothetical protein